MNMRIAAVVACVALPAFAQAPPPLTERIDVTLVSVDVTVLDRAGKPVRDLTKDDFEIDEDGVAQAITNFSAVMQDAHAPTTLTGPSPDPDPARQRSVVVIIDKRDFFKGTARSKVVDALQRLLDEASDDTRWSIVTLLDSFNTELSFTSDKELLHNALESLRRGLPLPKRRGVPAVAEQLSLGRGFAMPEPDCPSGTCLVRAFQSGVEAAQELHSDSSFFAAIIATARGMAWLPGKKTILVVSSSVPGHVTPTGTIAADAATEAALLHQAMVREANAADANIYVLDPAGVSGDFNIGHRGAGFVARGTSGAVWLAALTGGLYLPSNRMMQSVDMFNAATTNYYELGYHAFTDDGKYHRIDVRLKNPRRHTVIHREGYLRLSKEAAFERALLTPFGIASQNAPLPVSLTIGDPRPVADGKSMLPLRAAIPLSRATFLERRNGSVGRLHVYVSVFASNGRLVDFRHYVETVTERTKADLVVKHDIALKKGTFRLFVTVRDELSDAVGVAAKEIGL
jgi:VWFA-related protein